MGDDDAEAKKKVYDRQIRLWGAEAQEKIGKSKVFFWGLNGVNVEACKNLILAGISVTVFDDRIVTKRQLGTNFFLRESDVGKKTAMAAMPRIAELNPFATAVAADEITIEGHAALLIERTSDEVFHKVEDVTRSAREKGIAIFYTRCDADKGFITLDLGNEYKYVDEKKEPWTASFPCFGDRFFADNDWHFARKKQPVPRAIWFEWIDMAFFQSSESSDYASFAKGILEKNKVPADVVTPAMLQRHRDLNGAQLAHITAVVGGELGQETIKVLTGGQGEPINNIFIFDTETDAGTVFRAFDDTSEPPAKKIKTSSAPTTTATADDTIAIDDSDDDGPIEID